MSTLPNFVQEKLQPRLKVIWWGKRCTYEMVEELSNGLFWQYIVFGTAYNISKYGEFDGWMYWFAVGVIILMASQRALLEVISWNNEIYVVGRDEVNGGGRVYKFWGWPTRRSIDDAITAQSPSISIEDPWYWRLWGWATGEKMSRAKLGSVIHGAYIEGRKISPQFEKSIKFIRGYRPPKEDLPATSLANIGYLQDAKMSGIIRDAKFLEDAARAMISRTVYGE